MSSTLRLAMAAGSAFVASVHGTIDVARPGPDINKNDDGQCAEHLGTGIYKGMWVGPDSSIPHTKGWPQVDARDLNRH